MGMGPRVKPEDNGVWGVKPEDDGVWGIKPEDDGVWGVKPEDDARERLWITKYGLKDEEYIGQIK